MKHPVHPDARDLRLLGHDLGNEDRPRPRRRESRLGARSAYQSSRATDIVAAADGAGIATLPSPDRGDGLRRVPLPAIHGRKGSP
jgi:DNA-binding transcriptional LysR family regulator